MIVDLATALTSGEKGLHSLRRRLPVCGQDNFRFPVERPNRDRHAPRHRPAPFAPERVAVSFPPGRTALSRLASLADPTAPNRPRDSAPHRAPWLCSRMRDITLRCVASCITFKLQTMGGAVLSLPHVWDALRTSSMVASKVSASTVLQTFLDGFGETIMAERFDTFSALIRLPLRIRTSAANLRVDSVEDLADGFDEFTEMIRSRGVTRIARSVRAAMWEGNDCIVGIYETRLMDATRLVLPSFHSKMWLGHHDGVWQATRIHNTTNDARWPILLTRLAPEPWPPEEI